MIDILKRIGLLLVGIICASCSEDVEANIPASTAVSNVTVSGTLPVMYIETENHEPVLSKTVYINATYYLDPMGAEDVEPLGSQNAPLAMQIRGRGHSSWKGVKKPYKLKLDKKAGLLGMAPNKHWALIKPLESIVAGLKLGELMDMAWTPGFRPVEVVLNGDYIGLYFLTETIRIGQNRVNIYEQQDGETDPALIGGGWLVEVDNYKDQCQITVPENSAWNLTLRYHSPEVLSGEQLQWLTNEFTSINRAVYASDKTSTAWEDYIDIESMARFFIIQEVMDNPDGFHGSFYLHKDLAEGARWVAGPLWDMSCYNREKTDYTFRMKVHYGFTPHWIGELIQYDSFCRAVADAWREVYPSKLSEIYDYIDDVVLPLDRAWSNDSERWDFDRTQTAPVRAESIKAALARNIEWFNSHLPVSPYPASCSEARGDSQQSVKAYNLQGVMVGEFHSEAAARAALAPGLYIINGRKTLIR